MTRAKVTPPTHTHRAQHPRMLSSSSSISSSSSSCSLPPGPSPRKTTTTTTIVTSTTARKRSSWMLSHHEKPSWEDTATATPFEGQQQRKQKQQQSHSHNDHQRHQKSDSCDQVVPTTNPHSPPSSPLPLGLHKQNGATKAPVAAEDMDSEDDQQDRRYKQHPTDRIVDQRRTSATSDYSSGHSVSPSSTRRAMQAVESATAARSRRKEGSGSTRQIITAPTAEIPSRPRFSFSTVVNPRPQVYPACAANREAPTKDAPTKSTATVRSTRSVKETASTPRVTKSTVSSTLGHAQPTTKSISSTTRISKSRSPTTITTTTTTTTRRVASTTITMGPHLDREHRKLAVTANVSATVAATSTSAHSTKTSSSNRKEKMGGATSISSNISPSATAGKATMSREGGRQTKAEPVVEHADAAITIHTTTPAEHTNVIYDKSATQHLDIRSDAIPKVTTTATLTTAMTTLLPPLQMKGDEESPAVIECPRLAQDRSPAPTKVVTIEPSPPSPSLPPPPPYEAKAEMLLPILNSPIMVASSHLKTPSPPTKIVILHESPSSDIVPQTPETPSVAASSPPKEMPPIVQEHQKPTEVGLAQPPAAGMATPLSKSHTSSGIANSTSAHTSISAPPTFLSGSSRIFRVLRETSRPCLLGGIQQQQQQLKSASQSDEYTEGGGREHRVGVNTNIHRSNSGELVPFTDEPMGTLTAQPIALTATSILTTTPVTESSTRDETSGPQNQQQQPFRKNIWNGRTERFNKPRSTTSLHEEAIPTTQGTISDRTGLLAAVETTVLRAPLTKIKDPAVMRDLMALAKERRASRTLCDIVVEDGPSAAQYDSGNQFKDRSRKMTTKHEHRGDNDNDTFTTTTSTTKYNNQNSNNGSSNYATTNPLSASTPSRKITLEDKRAFLKTQETLRRNNLRRSRDLQTVDLSISSPNYPFPPSPSPAAAAQDSLTVDIHPGFPCSQGQVATQPIPAMSVTVPLKVVTVLQGMGYPINNNTNPNNASGTSPLCSSPSPSLSPTWSTPSTPHIIPSSHSSTSISSLSSTSTASSSVSSISSSLSSASSKTLPLSFPDRLFQARSPSSSAGSSTTMLPRSFSSRPVRATSITEASAFSSSTGEKHLYYSGPSYNSQTPSQSSIMLPSLPSPALSLVVPERQRVSNRSADGYFKPHLFPGSRSEDEQSPSQQARQHTLRPFERALVHQQHQQQNKLIPPQHGAGACSGSSVTKSSSMPQPFPLPPSSPTSPSSLSLTDPDDTTTALGRERRGARERSVSTTSIDRSFTEPPTHVHYTQNQYTQEDQQYCAPTPVTQDISFLTKRLANLQLMDSLCPVSVSTTPAPVLAPIQTLHSQPQPQQQEGGMDATWAMQIQLLLTHLAEQTDIEQESRPRPLPPPPRPLSLLLPIPEETEPSQKKWTGKVEGVGLYKQVLTDWLLRLDQLAAVSSLGGGSLYKVHPGLKREIEKIRWQHNVPSTTNRPK